MDKSPRIALLGFLPWTDPARGVEVRENPAAITADLCARELAGANQPAAFIPVPVSDEGIHKAMEMVRLLDAEIVVAFGQTRTEPRVERYGRVPSGWAPAAADEQNPWLLAPDADALVDLLNTHHDPASQTQPFRTSDDAGAYFCDHLCVELARDARRRQTRSRFLHLTATDGCPPDTREARLRQYVRQARATVEWLMQLTPGGAFG